MEEWNNEMNYKPAFVDIEGLQGINSTQGMENLMQDIGYMSSIYGMNEMEQNPMWPPMEDSMYPYPMEGMDPMYNIPPMDGMDPMYNNMPPMGSMDHMHGMENMYNMGPMLGMDNMNGYNMAQGGTCAGVISCMATMCYMMSIFFTQMLQNGNGMGAYPMPMQDCDCMQNYTMDNTYGYPPMY